MTQSYGIPKKRRNGQAMVEYVIVLVVLSALISVTALLLYATRSQSQRAAELVSSEYP
jgi:type II secretory pathway pseudopilin PulG